MHQNWFSLSIRTLNEVKYLLSDSVICVKKDLVLAVNPVESQVDYADVLPVVGELATAAVYYASNFVREDKLQILITETERLGKVLVRDTCCWFRVGGETYLRGIFIANEKTVFDFDCSYNVRFLN